METGVCDGVEPEEVGVSCDVVDDDVDPDEVVVVFVVIPVSTCDSAVPGVFFKEVEVEVDVE